MRKIFLLAILAVFLTSFASAQLIFNSQPNTLYNVGDVVELTTEIISTADVNEFFSINLVCSGIETPVYQQYILLSAGRQVSIPAQVPLILDFINGTSGTCKLKAMLKDGNVISDYSFTDDFRVSDLVIVSASLSGKEFSPGEHVFISGSAVKENGENAHGVAEIRVNYQNSSLYSGFGTVANGYFYFNFTLPQNAPAGQKLVSINVYETDSSSGKTNKGFTNFNLLVRQIPTTLDLVAKDSLKEILPGRTYSVKGILYDQTGGKINSAVNFIVKKSNGEIMKQGETSTDKFLDIPVSYNDAPDTWNIFAESESLTASSGFDILKNEAVSVELINRTLLVTNTGNVPYNKPLTVKVDGESIAFDVSLGVDQSRKYVLTAPKGDHSVEVSGSSGNLFSGSAFLTGNAVNIREATEGVLSFIQNKWWWPVIVLVLAFATFFFFRKSHKKRFLKKVNMDKKFRLRDGILVSEDKGNVFGRNRMIRSKNIAELSLSIQGEKQGSSVVCLNLKNMKDIMSGKGGVAETMNRLSSVVDDANASVYENDSCIFFIFAPVKTKAFNNELSAIETAEKIQRILEDHNRLLKQKIDFGISVNYGMMVIKQGLVMKFMSIGNIMSSAKKLALLSHGEIFLSSDIKNRTATDIKTERQSSGELEFYTLVEIRNREKSQKFIREFMSKLEREEKQGNRKFFE
jgi:hypothetical protein